MMVSVSIFKLEIHVFKGGKQLVLDVVKSP
jgi:hypothetical protein